MEDFPLKFCTLFLRNLSLTCHLQLTSEGFEQVTPSLKVLKFVYLFSKWLTDKYVHSY